MYKKGKKTLDHDWWNQKSDSFLTLRKSYLEISKITYPRTPSTSANQGHFWFTCPGGSPKLSGGFENRLTRAPLTQPFKGTFSQLVKRNFRWLQIRFTRDSTSQGNRLQIRFTYQPREPSNDWSKSSPVIKYQPATKDTNHHRQLLSPATKDSRHHRQPLLSLETSRKPHKS